MPTHLSSEFPESTAPIDSLAGLHEAVRRRAQEIYETSGRIPGRDVENWMQAEREIQREVAERSKRRSAVVVKVNGIDYVGEYSFAAADGYHPGEFSAGDPVAVRFEEDRMYVKRPNGKELETKIVKTCC
jgi:hypothetical protein